RLEELRQLHDGVGGKMVHPKTKPGQNLRKNGVQQKTQTGRKEVPEHNTLSIARVWCNLITRGTANSGAKIPFLHITLDQLPGRPRLTKNESSRRLLPGPHQLRRISVHVGQILLSLRQLPSLLFRRLDVLGSNWPCSNLQPSHP